MLKILHYKILKRPYYNAKNTSLQDFVIMSCARKKIKSIYIYNSPFHAISIGWMRAAFISIC